MNSYPMVSRDTPQDLKYRHSLRRYLPAQMYHSQELPSAGVTSAVGRVFSRTARLTDYLSSPVIQAKGFADFDAGSRFQSF